MKKIIFIWILSIVLLSSFSVNSQNVSKDTSQVSKESLTQQEKGEPLAEIEKLRDDNYEKAMEAANRSINLANLVLALVAVLIAASGIFTYIKVGDVSRRIKEELAEIRKLKQQADTSIGKVEEDSKKIRGLKDDCEQEFKKTVNLRSSIESLKTEAEIVIGDVKRSHEDIIKIGEDIQKARKDIADDRQSVDESKTEVSAISAFTEGWSLGEAGKYEESIEKYKKATELKPDYAEAYNNWGVALGKLGRYEEAIEKSKKAIELKPDSARAYINWGWSLGKLGKHEEEMEKYEKARELKPDNATAWFNIASVYALQNKKEEALENLRRAIALDPSFKEKAKKDAYFKNLWEDEDFKRLVE